MGCELLSEVSIFDIRNNQLRFGISKATVVNCFQKLVSLIFGTTFKGREDTHFGCELLSEVSIFDIRNNEMLDDINWLTVVNCFQKLVSLIFGTTGYVYFQ